MTPAEVIQQKVAHIKSLLDSQNPGIENYLRDIHQNLQKDESLVQFLTPEDMGVIVRGLELKAKMKIVEDAVSKKPSKASLSKLSMDDI